MYVKKEQRCPICSEVLDDDGCESCGLTKEELEDEGFEDEEDDE